MLRKIFSRKAFIIAGISYALVILVYFIGYVTHSGGGFIDFGPSFSGIVLSALAAPFIIIGKSIYIIVKKQNIKYVLVGYLILTVGVGGISIGSVITVNRYQEIIRIQQRQKMVRQDIDFIENAIGDEVWRIYPTAEFYMDYQGSFGDVVHRHAVIKLGGFRYENQPDFDEEKSKWREITQSVAFRNFPHRLSVRYYFENARDAFAFILLSDFTLFYSPLGMSEDGFAYLSPFLEEYLSNFHDNFSIFTDWRFRVTIYKELSSENEENEEEMWRNFVKLYNINTELVQIEVAYRLADAFGGRNYDVRQNRWF